MSPFGPDHPGSIGAPTILEPGVPEYPTNRLNATRFSGAPITAVGNAGLIARHQMVSLFCSVRCPGDLILKTYDLARALRDAGAPVIGGFHSPMEKECLRLLLRGRQPVVVCPARGIENMRIPSEWRTPLAEGSLLLLSPFSSSQRRPTADLVAIRNDFLAALAQRIFIAHAAAGGKTEAFARKVLDWGKPVFTFDSGANAGLIFLGVKPLNLEKVTYLLRR